MQAERVRRFPAPVQAQGFGRRPRAANDNEPEIGESVASIVIGRSLLVGAALLVVAFAVAGGVWLVQAVGRHFG
ncbi:hypothetical protein [Bosea sp. (in: a-proteobacteria)]|uniref:hypothetical protein n=1 Tax=Bosea sp. (in: a-proteobacteria) TaxID=1871050 RepID=UPI00260C4F6E|nr:hypothetical protein [Bosea sp. (in: a-proteobacteria)]MCO5093554.1 hypothetical protein [Bosea sp. (in: a-proteobacteria)]